MRELFRRAYSSGHPILEVELDQKEGEGLIRLTDNRRIPTEYLLSEDELQDLLRFLGAAPLDPSTPKSNAELLAEFSALKAELQRRYEDACEKVLPIMEALSPFLLPPKDMVSGVGRAIRRKQRLDSSLSTEDDAARESK